jgi:hypothetical protein
MSYTDPCYAGLDSLSEKRIVFINNKLAAISGQLISQQIPLNDFFIPITSSVVTDFSIAANSSIALGYCNIENVSGQVNAIFLFVNYDSEVPDADKYIEWSWDESTWYPIGKILALSSAENNMLDQIYLRNPSITKPVTVTAMIAT